MKKKPEIFTEEEYERHKVFKSLANISSDSVINAAEAVEEAADAISQLLSKVDKLESKKAKKAY